MFNRFLLREPFDTVTDLPDITFAEKELLYGDAVWTLGALCGKSIHAFGWPTCFHRHGIVYLEDLPIKADEKNRFLTTEVHLNSDRIYQMTKCGLCPISSLYNEDSLFLTADSTVSAHSISYQLMLSRIAHFVIQLRKRMEEEMAEHGPFSPENLEQMAREAVKSFLNPRGQTSLFVECEENEIY